MEILEKIKNWLTGFPLWGNTVLSIDTLEGKPDCCGLFPLGLEQLSADEDVTGNVTLRCRMRFILRRSASRGQEASAWLLAFQDWVRQQSLLGQCPAFGDVPGQERLSAEQGRQVAPASAGMAVWEVRLTAEFIKRHEVN